MHVGHVLRRLACGPTPSLLDPLQLPHFRDALARVCALIKPSGHLIVEEIDARVYSELQETPEAVTYFYDRLDDWIRSKGENYEVGSQLQPSVSKLGMFIDVTVKVLAVPFSPGWEGRKCLDRNYYVLPTRFFL